MLVSVSRSPSRVQPSVPNFVVHLPSIRIQPLSARLCNATLYPPQARRGLPRHRQEGGRILVRMRIDQPQGHSGHPLVAAYTTGRVVAATIVERAGPGWFTSVMGSAILALGMALSPIGAPLLAGPARALWIATVGLFAALLVFWLAHGLRYPSHIRSCLKDPTRAPLWGAPPIACLTIATGFLVIGRPLGGLALAPTMVLCAQVLWIAGVVGSLAAALGVPYLMFTRHQLSTEMTSGTWLLPVVPPLVVAVPGALLISSWPSQWRSSMLALGYALWGMGAILSAIVVVLFIARLAYYRVPTGALVTTVWIVLGPVGMSIAGIEALGATASVVWPTVGPALRLAGLAYSLPTWGFGVYWLALTLLVTLRAARLRLPFTLGWWAFTFPLGVMTTGTYALYGRTHAALFTVAGLVFLLLLVVLWVMVAAHSARQCLLTARNALALSGLLATKDSTGAAAKPDALPAPTTTPSRVDMPMEEHQPARRGE